MSKDERTIRDLAQEALDVQDACNLSGVVHAWSRSITRLRELVPNESTEFYNKHPISVLFADKVAHLTGTQTLGHPDVENCYTIVHVAVTGRATPR